MWTKAILQAADTVFGCIALHDIYKYVPEQNKNQRREAVRRCMWRELYQIPYSENIHIS